MGMTYCKVEDREFPDSEFKDGYHLRVPPHLADPGDGPVLQPEDAPPFDIEGGHLAPPGPPPPEP
jgi:hypothetical protein